MGGGLVIVGLVRRKTKLEGDAKETFDKLQTAAATVVAPLFVGIPHCLIHASARKPISKTIATRERN